jgi:hypothetical protein
MTVARREKKPLFVGEFGVPGADTPEARARFALILSALRTNQVPLSALWVFDYDYQANDWNVTATNARRWQLEAIQQANQELRRQRATSNRDPPALKNFPPINQHHLPADRIGLLVCPLRVRRPQKISNSDGTFPTRVSATICRRDGTRGPFDGSSSKSPRRRTTAEPSAPRAVGSDALEKGMVPPAVADLRRLDLQITRKFPAIHATRKRFDWADGRGWRAWLKRSVSGWLVREGGAKVWRRLRSRTAKTRGGLFRRRDQFAETAALAATRRAVHRSLAAENAHASCSSCFSTASYGARARRRTGVHPRTASYGLLPAFFQRHARRRAAGVGPLDGCENGYYFDSGKVFNAPRSRCDPGPGPASNSSPRKTGKIPATSAAGFGFYSTCCHDRGMLLRPAGRLAAEVWCAPGARPRRGDE